LVAAFARIGIGRSDAPPPPDQQAAGAGWATPAGYGEATVRADASRMNGG